MQKKNCLKSHFRVSVRLIFFQILIVCIFGCLWFESRPISDEETQKTEIIVEQTTYERGFNEYRFVIFSNSEAYLFANSGRFSEYSNYELYETISVGDKISITYYERNGLFGKNNYVLEASNQDNIYRSINKYNKGKKTISSILIILFVIFEFVFIGMLFIKRFYKL